MKKQLTIVAGILLTLGTAVSATLGSDTRLAGSTATAEAALADVGAEESARIVEIWKAHANTAASVPLSRPL